MTTTIGEFTTAVLVVCVISIALCAFFYFRCVALECDVDIVQESKDALRESMSNANYDLHQVIERLKREKHAQRKKLTAEIHALRTQLHQLRKERNTQSNG